MFQRVFCRRIFYLGLIFCALSNLGCSHIAERVADHLATEEVRRIQGDITLLQGDLSLFRGCLSRRGGSCKARQAADPVPQSREHLAGQKVQAIQPPSTTLSQAVSQLPDGHGAKIALSVLQSPVTQSAVGLHNHLRGLKSHHQSSPADRSEAESSAGLTHFKLSLHHLLDFHENLLGSLATGAWAALHDQCRQLLKSHAGSPNLEALTSSCRQVTFIRGYLAAYLDNGQILEVDISLAQLVVKIQNEGSALQTKIQSLQNRLTGLASDAQSMASLNSSQVSDEAQNLRDQVEQWLQSVVAHLGSKDPTVSGDSAASTSNFVVGKAGQLAQFISQNDPQAAQAAARDLSTLLDSLNADLSRLSDQVGTLDQGLVHSIESGIDQANSRLSNVFRVSKVGFVSRQGTFQARLPTLELTLDPSAKSLLTLTDQNTGQELTSHSSWADLGVAQDTSGVGTGSSIAAEVTRVFLEAIFDAHEGLPALAPLNAGNLQPTGLTLAGASATALDLEEFALPAFQLSADNPINAADLQQILRINGATALQTRLTVSRAVSGLGPFSLNNPPLEALITEVITVTVLKAMEKASWCWFACELDGAVDSLRADVDSAITNTLENKLKTDEQKLRAEVKSEEEKLHEHIHDAEQHLRQAMEDDLSRLKLRLHIDTRSSNGKHP